MYRVEVFLLFIIVIVSDIVVCLFVGFNEGCIKWIFYFVIVVNVEFIIVILVSVVIFVLGFSFLEIG